jgi:hypothetical protein
MPSASIDVRVASTGIAKHTSLSLPGGVFGLLTTSLWHDSAASATATTEANLFIMFINRYNIFKFNAGKDNIIILSKEIISTKPPFYTL